MANFDALPGTLYQVSLRYTCPGSEYMWYRNWYLTLTPLPAGGLTAYNMMDSVLQNAYTWIGPLCSNRMVWNLMTVEEYSLTTGPTGRGSSYIIDVPGQAVVGCLPPACCFLIRYRTAGWGRRYNGRVYLSGLAKTMSDGGRWTSGNLNDLRTRANNLATHPIYNGASPAQIGAYRVLKRASSGPPTFAPFDPMRVIRGDVDLIIRQQRRRALKDWG